MSDDRATLSVKKPSKSTDQLRTEMALRDWQNLVLNDGFLRTLFTILDIAGIFTGNYQPGGRDLAFSEGRRSLGLDILRTAEKFLGPDALLRILEAEKKTQIGGSIGRRNTNNDDRNDDGDDGDPAVDRNDVQYLDYGTGNAGS